MKIADSSLQMASTHASTQRHEVRESLKRWVGPQRPQFAGEESRPRPVRNDNTSLSDAGELQPGAETPAIAAPPATEAPARPMSAGYGIEYVRHEPCSEAEQTTFSASGTVTTADGRETKFDLQLSMARKVDPLVLNFAGNAAQLTDQRFAFDLNADGSTENINFLAPGSGFLALDRNGDSKINNGSELFGPTSGDGFEELAALDGDKNGWIDENDAAFSQLAIWAPDKSGKDTRQSPSDAGVGAIALTRTATPFDLKKNANVLFREIRTSGIFLHETGTTGTIQQIDLTA
ncbi:MAG: VCBS repeat-containing protein [Azonexus sp.]|nr:VCBS repeat-containing protein [Azonexus sp.]